MDVEQLMEWEFGKETNVLWENSHQYILLITNPTRPDMGSNLDRCDRKLATDWISCDTARAEYMFYPKQLKNSE
jgi:hypothetical protein